MPNAQPPATSKTVSAPVAAEGPGPGGARRLRRFLPAVILAAGLVAGWAMGWYEYLALERLADARAELAATVDAHPVLAPVAYAVLYALAVALSVPAASVLTVFGGFLFGWKVGFFLVAVAATAGATLLFLAARSAFGDALRRRIGGRAATLAEGFENNAFAFLLALRLAPVMPFFVVNIAPALFSVRLRDYVAATFLGILPGVFAYSYLGSGIEGVIAAAEAAGRAPRLSDLVSPQITVAFALLAVVALVPVFIRRQRSRG